MLTDESAKSFPFSVFDAVASDNEVNATVYEAVCQTLLSCTPEIW